MEHAPAPGTPSSAGLHADSEDVAAYTKAAGSDALHLVEADLRLAGRYDLLGSLHRNMQQSAQASPDSSSRRAQRPGYLNLTRRSRSQRIRRVSHDEGGQNGIARAALTAQVRQLLLRTVEYRRRRRLRRVQADDRRFPERRRGHPAVNARDSALDPSPGPDHDHQRAVARAVCGLISSHVPLLQSFNAGFLPGCDQIMSRYPELRLPASPAAALRSAAEVRTVRQASGLSVSDAARMLSSHAEPVSRERQPSPEQVSAHTENWNVRKSRARSR